MSRGVLVRFFLVLGLLVGCVALAVNVKPHLGLDLGGGAQFIFQAEGTEETPATAENVDKTLEVLRGRVDALGVAESTLARSGRGPDPRRAARRHQRRGGPGGRGAHRPDRPADHPPGRRQSPSPTPSPARRTTRSSPTDQGDTLEVGPTVIAGDEITGASAVQRDQSVELDVVAIDFNGKGGSAWADSPARPRATRRATPSAGSRSSSTARSSPRPRSTDVGCDVGIRGGSTDITGNFTPTEAKDLAAADRGRRAAARARRRSPTASSARPWVRRRSTPPIEAGIIGLILTGLFIIFVYRLVGFAGHDRARVVRPAGLRHARRPRLDADAARPRRLRARHRHGDRRQRARLRESQGGVRRLPVAPGLRRALQVGFNKAWIGDHRLQRHHPAGRRPAVLPRLRARSRASVSRCPSVSSPR